MSIVVRFTPTALTPEHYDETVSRFEERFGEGYIPDGCQLHVAFVDNDGSVRVSEIWDSVEQFQAFGEMLMPVLQDAGIEFSGEPEIFQVHRIETR